MYVYIKQKTTQRINKIIVLPCPIQRKIVFGSIDLHIRRSNFFEQNKMLQVMPTIDNTETLRQCSDIIKDVA